jgi:hypothetical protein
MVALTRGVPAGMATALASGGAIYPVLFVWLDWPGATLRAHTGRGTITWGGYDWAGVGPFGSVGVPGETGGSMAAAEAQVSLVADPAALDAYLDDVIRNRPGAIYLGCLTTRPGEGAADVLLADPVVLFEGLMDGLMIEVEPTAEGVSQRAVVSLVTGPGARSDAAVYHSDQDQARKYPGDTAGRQLVLAYAQAQKFLWPEN